MKDFLREVAEHILFTHGHQLSRLQVVFPNRRAGLFLLRHLSEMSKQPLWAPQVLSVEQFLEQFSDLKRADSLLLSFKLFPLYQKLMPTEQSFDQFYPWAEIILKDFNSLDQQCVDAEKLFVHLQDLKELEGNAFLTDEQKEAISRFWKGFEKGNDASDYKKNFLAFWQVLPKLYTCFKAQLLQEGIGYSGLLARQAAEQEGLSEKVPADFVLFCGFNALTRAEELIMKKLLQTGKAAMLWDVDEHMLHPEQEAGLFMRRWKKDNLFGPTFPDPVPARLTKKQQDKISLSALPLDHVQAREVCLQLQQQLASETDITNKALTRTAIVLPDESQLFPLLYQLPEALEKSTINVTMGVPLRITPVYSLLESLLELQRTCSKGEEETYFHHSPIISLLRHAYIRGLDPQKVQDMIHHIEKNNHTYVSQTWLQQNDKLAPIFLCAPDGLNRGKYLLDILELINQQLRKVEHQQLTLEEEYISRTRTHLERMLETAEEAGAEMSTELLENLMRHLLQQLKIPFVGEPLNGLQIMGMLETRCLDFDHLYILSLNEGVVPAAADEPSLIPYFIRSAYGLPTIDEHDAIYAYNFYRLLQRAGKVHLFYSTHRSGGKPGEMSRYIKQLQQELYPQLKPYHVHLKAKPAIHQAIQLSKEELKEHLKKYADNGEAARPLSPSALNSFLHCRLQFALRYLVSIKEPDEVADEIDSSAFGQIMHQVLQDFYQEFKKGEEITAAAIIEKLQETSVFERVLTAYQQNFGHVPFLGRNSFPLQIIAEMVSKVLEVDQNYAPFRIVSLEQKYQMKVPVLLDGKTLTMRLHGHIDRVDEKEGCYRVVDYKTGKDMRSFKSVADLFNRDISDRNKAAMQVLLYTLMYASNANGQLEGKKLQPALYNSKELYSQDFDGLLKVGESPISHFSDSIQDDIREKLTILLADLMDSEQPFDQREDEKGCEYCGYAGICGR